MSNCKRLTFKQYKSHHKLTASDELLAHNREGGKICTTSMIVRVVNYIKYCIKKNTQANIVSCVHESSDSFRANTFLRDIANAHVLDVANVIWAPLS